MIGHDLHRVPLGAGDLLIVRRTADDEYTVGRLAESGGLTVLSVHADYEDARDALDWRREKWFALAQARRESHQARRRLRAAVLTHRLAAGYLLLSLAAYLLAGLPGGGWGYTALYGSWVIAAAAWGVAYQAVPALRRRLGGARLAVERGEEDLGTRTSEGDTE